MQFIIFLLIFASTTLVVAKDVATLWLYSEANCQGTKSTVNVGPDPAHCHDIPGTSSFSVQYVSGKMDAQCIVFRADGSACIGHSTWTEHDLAAGDNTCSDGTYCNSTCKNIDSSGTVETGSRC
jgi:hypothetical protein